MAFPSYYSRQIALPEVGLDGQKRLAEAKCLVIGAGGLGSPALLYLAAAGVGTIGVCDGDVLEESNLHRQILFTTKDLGKNKGELAAGRLKDLNPLIEVISYPFRFSKENAGFLFSCYDLVLDCTDNFRTKFLINDASFFYKKPLVRASIYQFEGQIQTYFCERGDPCLRCLWKEVPEEGCVGNCQQAGILGPIAGYFGVLQAVEALKLILKLPTLHSKETLFVDLIHYTQHKIECERRSDCPLCGQKPTIFDLIENYPWEVRFSKDVVDQFCWVDIREAEEVVSHPCPHMSIHMPLSSLNLASIDKNIPYLFFCQKGKRSASLVKKLRDLGWENVYSLIGGTERNPFSLGT